MSEFKITLSTYYRQRDGGKAEVFAKRGSMHYGMTDTGAAWSWLENGFSFEGTGTQKDLVSVWRDETEEPWTPTCEFRWQSCGAGHPSRMWFQDGLRGFFFLNQKWTRGDKSEWRPVEVVT